MAKHLKVWSRFFVKKNAATLKFKIVEGSSEHFEDAVQLLMDHYLEDEALAEVAGITKCEDAKEEYRQILFHTFRENLSMMLCCVDNDDNSDKIEEIAGGAFMWLTENDLLIEQRALTKEVQKFFDIINATTTLYSPIAALKVNKYNDVRFVVVHPRYRGCGIANELFRLMPLVSREKNVPITVGLMTAYGSQKAAERAGWETVFEFNLQEFGKTLDVTFQEGSPPTVKVMVIKTP